MRASNHAWVYPLLLLLAFFLCADLCFGQWTPTAHPVALPKPPADRRTPQAVRPVTMPKPAAPKA